MEKIVLVSNSQGERGQAGKKKVYEIEIDGRFVTLSWGMAEKAERQTQMKAFTSAYEAEKFAYYRKGEKVVKGYKVAYTA